MPLLVIVSLASIAKPSANDMLITCNDVNKSIQTLWYMVCPITEIILLQLK
jgi:hypothetical protein